MTTNDMPERVFCWIPVPHTYSCWSCERRAPDDVEYVRADLVPDNRVSAAIDKARADELRASQAQLDRARMAVEGVILAAEGTPFAAMLKVALAALGDA